VMVSSVGAISSQRNVPSDDAYHYRDFHDGRHDANYIEWWYFNLFAEDIQVVFHYSIINPDNYLDRGMAGVGVIAFSPEGVVEATDWFSPDLISASYEKADVRIPDLAPFPNSIEVSGDGVYRIVGHIRKGSWISWDLTYEPLIDPWFARDSEKVGLFDWEEMSWLVYMPGARVTGSIVINGRTYCINRVKGYHDHNWGEWITTNAMWNWAQYFDPEKGLALEIGDFMGKPVGVVSLEFDNVRMVFERDQYHLLHTRWTLDPENQKWFPAISWLVAENETWRLIARLETLDTEPVLAPLKMPSFLPEVIVYEQTARYTGGLWEKTEEGEWALLMPFHGKGFKEYTGLKWIP
jgi:hypothetical protein